MKATLYVSIRGQGTLGKDVDLDFVPPVGMEMLLADSVAGIGAEIGSDVERVQCFLPARCLQDGKPELVVWLEDIEPEPNNPADAPDKWGVKAAEIAKDLKKEDWTYSL